MNGLARKSFTCGPAPRALASLAGIPLAAMILTDGSICEIAWIAGTPSIQLMESATETGVHHYGYVTDDVEQTAKEFKEKGAQILRENRDAAGKLTTIFVKDPNGLELEIRSPR